jgi:ribonuclease R
MKKAHYSENCAIHFGLACDCYCHFTSPIRSYPDLCIHRIIKDHLRGRLNDKKIEHYREMLPTVALDTSRTERRSEECEREVLKLKKAEYLMDRMYEVYEGVISGVTNWGIYVELDNTCEGLVHVSSLTGDFYRFDEEKYELRGEGTGKTFRLGEKLKVMVNNVDLSTRTVDFIIADFDETVHDFYRNGKRVI